MVRSGMMPTRATLIANAVPTARRKSHPTCPPEATAANAGRPTGAAAAAAAAAAVAAAAVVAATAIVKNPARRARALIGGAVVTGEVARALFLPMRDRETGSNTAAQATG